MLRLVAAVRQPLGCSARLLLHGRHWFSTVHGVAESASRDTIQQRLREGALSVLVDSAANLARPSR